MTHTISPATDFRTLKRDLNESPSHLYPEYGLYDWFEPFEYREAEDKVSFVSESGRTKETATTAHWVDANRRWEIQGRIISDAGLIFVPEQEGIALTGLLPPRALHGDGGHRRRPGRGLLPRGLLLRPARLHLHGARLGASARGEVVLLDPRVRRW